MPYSPTIALLTRSALALCPAVIGYESLAPGTYVRLLCVFKTVR